MNLLIKILNCKFTSFRFVYSRDAIYFFFSIKIFQKFYFIPFQDTDGSIDKESACNAGDGKRLPRMRGTWIRSLGQGNALEKEKATHSSILALEISWTEELGRLQSMELQE